MSKRRDTDHGVVHGPWAPRFQIRVADLHQRDLVRGRRRAGAGVAGEDLVGQHSPRVSASSSAVARPRRDLGDRALDRSAVAWVGLGTAS